MKLSRNTGLILFLMGKTGESWGKIQDWLRQIDAGADAECAHGADFPCKLFGKDHDECDYTGLVTPDTKLHR